ncbi:MAG: GNAT family N-acetyltransferase [Actinomycetota bacterium]
MTTGMRSSAAIDLRPWPNDPSVCHLILRDHVTVPAGRDVDRWVERVVERSDDPTVTIRTSALFPDAAAPFLARDFRAVDRLALLERRLHRPDERTERTATAPRSTTPIRLRRMSRRRLRAAVDIDRRAFGPVWANDLGSLRHAIAATPQVRVRIAQIDDESVGFVVTGKAAHLGYLQRLAVVPDVQRRGVARALVEDGLDWLTRGGATSVLVNTGLDNEPALRLYRSLEFRRRPEELVVLECTVPTGR